MFTAADIKGGKVILNNKMNIILKPSPIKGQPFTVTMTPTAGKNRMFLVNFVVCPKLNLVFIKYRLVKHRSLPLYDLTTEKHTQTHVALLLYDF